MKKFIIDIELPEVITEDFISKIPEQREVVDKLLLDGKIYFYSLAFDRSKLWMGVHADNEAAVWNILYSLPLIEYMNADIHELAFHNSAKAEIYELSLN
jgi:muconolactone delta-isomerase